MCTGPDQVGVRFFDYGTSPDLDREYGALRKKLFVDQLGWTLAIEGDVERDEFDTDASTSCLLSVGNRYVGGFRAIPCNRPYLACQAFPFLATTRRYPTQSDCTEISRFGVLPSSSRLGPALYAAMLYYGRVRGSRALIAMANRQHERLLRRLGIRTRRYGPPQIVGYDRDSNPIEAVAGEIPLNQRSRSVENLMQLARSLEICDDSLVLRPRRISA